MSPDRRTVLASGGITVAAGAVGLLAAACTSRGAEVPTPTASSRAPTPTATVTGTPPVLEVTGAPEGLASAVRAKYAGGPGGPMVAGGQATARLGNWNGSRAAVVTLGEDVTLAVETDAAWSVVGGWWPSLGQAEPDLGGGPQFVLALGSDARPGQPPYRSRSDVIQVLGIDGTGGGGVLGIARDVWATMPDGRQAKINAAMVYAGADGALETVRRVTGLSIGGYVATTFTGFEAIVDAWGGIPVLVERAVTTSHGRVEAGLHTLTGAQALSYARARKELPDGDFGRSRHQGDLLVAAAVKARLHGVGAVPELMSIAEPHCQTSVSAVDALRFGAAFHRLDPSRVGRFVAKGSFGWSSDGQSIVLLDAASRRAFAQFRSGRLP